MDCLHHNKYYELQPVHWNNQQPKAQKEPPRYLVVHKTLYLGNLHVSLN